MLSTCSVLPMLLASDLFILPQVTDFALFGNLYRILALRQMFIVYILFPYFFRHPY